MRSIAVAIVVLFAGTAAGAAPPDFSGIWQEASSADGKFHEPVSSPEAIFAGGEEEPLPGGEPQLREPYASEFKAARERKRAADKSGVPIADARALCLPLGMPTMMIPIFHIQILQTRQEMVVLAEEYMQTRRIYLNEKMPPADDIAPTYNGYSVGHWAGDTLVVETLGVREDVRLLDIPHSKEMKLTERLRLKAPGKLENRITIDDPGVLAKPYVFTVEYAQDPTYKIQEYVCENNRYRFDSDGGSTLDTNPVK